MKENILKNIFLIAILIFINFLSAQNSHSALTSGYFPLALGNSWTLKNNVTAETSTAVITGIQTFKDKSAFVCKTTYSNHSSTINTDYYSKTDTELLFSFGTENWIKLFQFPLDQGNKLDNTFSNGKSSLTVEVIGEEEITVPAGTHQCYKVKVTTIINTKENITINKVYVWFSSGIGWVKIQQEGKDAWELVEYKVQ